MKKLKILIVDDKAEDRKILRYYLETQGARVVEAADGSTGLVVALRELPDVIISDALMPEVDGFQLLHNVRRSPQLAGTSFIFYSAIYTGHRDQSLALSLGADAFIVKPKEPEEFWLELQKILAATSPSPRPFAGATTEDAFLKRYSSVVARKVEEKVVELDAVQGEFVAQEKRYRDIFHSIRDVIVITDFEGRILDANQPALRRVFGYDLAELRGLSSRYLYADSQGYERSRQELSSMDSGSEWKLFEVQCRRKAGASFPSEITGLQWLDERGRSQGHIAVIRDISQRRRAEGYLREALNASEEAKHKLDAVLRSMADGLLVTDQDNLIVLINGAAEKLLDVPRDRGILQPVAEILGEQALVDHILAAQSGAVASGPIDLAVSGPGRTDPRIVQAQSSLVQGRGEQRHSVITLLRDVTREREVERMKSEFIAVAAHELSTPLTTILGYAELLLGQETFSREEQREFLGYIYQKANLLERLIDDLLDISRIESGRGLILNMQPCQLGRVIEDLLRQYRQENPLHSFAANLPQEPLTVLADCGKLGQVLENLLSNAVKYSPGGGAVQVQAHVEEGMLQVSVRDEGIGMSPDQLERIFEKFYRADAANSNVAGLGLGMSIVKAIVENHGGTIWVESALGQGTCVTFTLPQEE